MKKYWTNFITLKLLILYKVANYHLLKRNRAVVSGILVNYLFNLQTKLASKSRDLSLKVWGWENYFLSTFFLTTLQILWQLWHSRIFKEKQNISRSHNTKREIVIKSPSPCSSPVTSDRYTLTAVSASLSSCICLLFSLFHFTSQHVWLPWKMHLLKNCKE